MNVIRVRSPIPFSAPSRAAVLGNLGKLSSAEAEKYKAEAKRYRKLMAKSGLFTKRRRAYEKKANAAARKYRQALKALRKSARSERKASRPEKQAGKGAEVESESESESEVEVDEGGVESAPAASTDKTPWLIAGIVLVVAVAAVASRGRMDRR